MSIDLATARLLAALLWPERSLEGNVCPAPEAFPKLVRALQANKVPLLSLDTANPAFAALYASRPFQDARAAEAEEHLRLREEYTLVRRGLANLDIRDMAIKSTGIKPALPYRSDNLDLLVPEHQGALARDVLLDLGYAELKNVEEPKKFLFRKFRVGQTVAAIHLHESVGWGTGFLDDAGVLARGRVAPDDRELWIPSREDALLITMAHAFYEDKAIKLAEVWKVARLLAEGPLDWELIYQQVSRRGWLEGLGICLSLWVELERALYGAHSFPQEVVRRAQADVSQDSRAYLAGRPALAPTFPYEVSFRFSLRHYFRKVRADMTLAPAQKRLDLARHTLAGIKRRLPFKSQRPMLVTLSGIDGCGKSAHAEALQAALKECDIQARIVWSRGGSSAFTDFFVRLVKPRLRRPADLDTQSGTRQAKVVRKALYLRNPLLRGGWNALVVLDLLAHYWRRVAWPLFRGKVVICERYTYDALVELAVHAGELKVAQGWAAKTLLALSPRPTLAYWLDLPATEALRRKPDEALGFMVEQGHVYEALAEVWHLQRLDTSDHLAASVGMLVDESLSEYYRDWHTLINGLFLANPMKRG